MLSTEVLFGARPSIRILLSYLPDNCEATCRLIKTEASATDLRNVVVWLLWNLQSGDAMKKYASTVAIGFEDALNAVKYLECEAVFCQVLLLLPHRFIEQIFAQILTLKCCEKHVKVLRALIQETLTNFTDNTLALDSHSRQISGFKNVITVLRFARSHLQVVASVYVKQFIVNVLRRISLARGTSYRFLINKFNTSPFSNISLLNTADGRRMKHLKEICDQQTACHQKPVLLYNELGVALLDAISILHSTEKELCESSTSRMPCLHFGLRRSIREFIEVLPLSVFADDLSNNLTEAASILLSMLNLEENPLSEDLCSCYSSPYSKSSFYTDLTLQKIHENRFNLLRHLCSLYPGPIDEILHALFEIEWPSEDGWSSVMYNYLVRYCTVNVLEKLLTATKENRSLSTLLLKYITHLSTRLCNSFIASHGISEELHGQDFAVIESLNKLSGCKSVDNAAVRRIAQLCVLAPRFVLREMFLLYYKQQLMLSVLAQIFEQLPSLLALAQANNTAVVLFSRAAYNHVDRSAETTKRWKALLIHLIENFPTHSALMNSVIEADIRPGFEGNDYACKHSDTMEILSAIIKHLKNSLNFGVLVDLVVSLLSFIESHHCSELAHRNLRTLFRILAKKHRSASPNVQNKTILLFKSVASTSSWTNSLYFYEFFDLACVASDIRVPDSLRVFTRTALTHVSYEPIKEYNEGFAHWKALFELCSVCPAYGDMFVRNITCVQAHYEMRPITDAVISLSSPQLSKHHASGITQCLTILLVADKFNGVEAFIGSELKHAVTSRAILFMFMVFTHAFHEISCTSGTNLRACANTLFDVICEAKQETHMQFRSILFLQMFEQLIDACVKATDSDWLDYLVKLLQELVMFTLREEKQTASRFEEILNVRLSEVSNSNVLREYFDGIKNTINLYEKSK